MTNPTFIAILDFSTAPTDRCAAIAQLERERPVVDAIAGCVGFRVFASRRNDTDVTVLHEWADEEAFDRYLASDAFARSGAVLRPLMTGTPTSRRFRVELVATVV